MSIADHPVVILDGVCAGSGAFRLGPLRLEIPRGTVTAIVGPNGSGKSTLFRALLGLEPLKAGRAEVLGTTVSANGDESYKAEIGFLAENPHPHENSMTVGEKAAFASLWYPGWNRERYKRLLDRFDIDERAKLSKLSKGMRRKAEFAVALAHEPELLLLDEPSSGLDPFAWKIMLEELNAFMETGDRTLIVATHVTEEVKRLADQILFLYRGRSLGSYEKDALFDAWRSLLVRAPDEGAGPDVLRNLPGSRGVARAGPQVYRVDVCGGLEEVETELRSCGFQVLESRRMELEDILGCLIQEEETNVEPA